CLIALKSCHSTEKTFFSIKKFSRHLPIIIISRPDRKCFTYNLLMKASLIITTYNWPEALDLVLESLECQSQKPHEVLIADDGSSAETRTLIEKFQASSAVTIKHLWHEDQGFRRTVILNKALAQAEGDYIIQLDGDCLMHRRFVEDHMHFAREGNFLFGSRVNIKRNFLPE